MDILKSSILYQTTWKVVSKLKRIYECSIMYSLIKHLRTAFENSYFMNLLLSKNAEKGILQQSYTYHVLQRGIKAIEKLIIILGKPFKAAVDNSGMTELANTTVKGFKMSPLGLIGLLGFVFILSNLIVSIVVAKGFTYPGTIVRGALLLGFLLLMSAKAEAKALQNSSFILRFIKYMVD